MRRISILAWMAVLILAVGYWYISQNKPDREEKNKRYMVQSTTQSIPIGGAFTLVDTQGHAVTEQSLLGHYTLLFFGFTYCPDICPTTLALVANAYDALSPAQQEKLEVTMVSVDPKRDTLEHLQNYVTAFNPNFNGWTGTKAQIDAITKAYLVYYTIMPPKDINQPNDYLVNHSGYLYLMGPDGEYIKHFPHEIGADELATQLKQLMQD